MEQDYYFISVPDTNKNPITNPKKDQNSFFVSDEGYDIEAPESRFPFVKKIKGGGGGILIFSHLPHSSGALRFSLSLDSHETFSERFLSWNWGMFSVSQVKQKSGWCYYSSLHPTTHKISHLPSPFLLYFN